ncbi:MAG: hypothetical protein ACYSUA_11895 [Planctomycetota bacterium]|jgi:hypothetical protein
MSSITMSNTRSMALCFSERTRRTYSAPGGMSNLTTATPAPSWPRLCCFSISRYSLRSPQAGSW